MIWRWKKMADEIRRSKQNVVCKQGCTENRLSCWKSQIWVQKIYNDRASTKISENETAMIFSRKKDFFFFKYLTQLEKTKEIAM